MSGKGEEPSRKEKGDKQRTGFPDLFLNVYVTRWGGGGEGARVHNNSVCLYRCEKDNGSLLNWTRQGPDIKKLAY